MTASDCRCPRRREVSQSSPDGEGDHANVQLPPPLIHLAFFLAAVGAYQVFPMALPTPGGRAGARLHFHTHCRLGLPAVRTQR